jgi:hypothetical protein
MTYPNVHIKNTDPDLYHIALMGIKAAQDYGYGKRKSYTFYFYNKYKTHVTKNLSGWSVWVSEIG